MHDINQTRSRAFCANVRHVGITNANMIKKKTKLRLALLTLSQLQILARFKLQNIQKAIFFGVNFYVIELRLLCFF